MVYTYCVGLQLQTTHPTPFFQQRELSVSIEGTIRCCWYNQMLLQIQHSPNVGAYQTPKTVSEYVSTFKSWMAEDINTHS